MYNKIIETEYPEIHHEIKTIAKLRKKRLKLDEENFERKKKKRATFDKNIIKQIENSENNYEEESSSSSNSQELNETNSHFNNQSQSDKGSQFMELAYNNSHNRSEIINKFADDIRKKSIISKISLAPRRFDLDELQNKNSNEIKNLDESPGTKVKENYFNHFNNYLENTNNINDLSKKGKDVATPESKRPSIYSNNLNKEYFDLLNLDKLRKNSISQAVLEYGKPLLTKTNSILLGKGNKILNLNSNSNIEKEVGKENTDNKETKIKEEVIRSSTFKLNSNKINMNNRNTYSFKSEKRRNSHNSSDSSDYFSDSAEEKLKVKVKQNQENFQRYQSNKADLPLISSEKNNANNSNKSLTKIKFKNESLNNAHKTKLLAFHDKVKDEIINLSVEQQSIVQEIKQLLKFCKNGLNSS